MQQAWNFKLYTRVFHHLLDIKRSTNWAHCWSLVTQFLWYIYIYIYMYIYIIFLLVFLFCFQLFLKYFVVNFLRLWDFIGNFITNQISSFFNRFLNLFFWGCFKEICCRLCSMAKKFLLYLALKFSMIFLAISLPVFWEKDKNA